MLMYVMKRTCQQLSEALNSVSSDVIKRTFDTLRTVTPTQLRPKSASNSIQRSQTTFTGHSSSQPFVVLFITYVECVVIVCVVDCFHSSPGKYWGIQSLSNDRLPLVVALGKEGAGAEY